MKSFTARSKDAHLLSLSRCAHHMGLQPPRQTTRKRETRLTSHSVEIVIDMLPIIIPTYIPTLGRIGGGLVVVSCVDRRGRARCWSVATVEYPPSDDCSPITEVWASSPQRFGSESRGELADRAPSPACGMNGRVFV